MSIEIKIWKLILVINPFKWSRAHYTSESRYDGGGFTLSIGPIIIDWIKFENSTYTR